MLAKHVENVLERAGFDFCECEGCFDIAAKRDFTFFIKVLNNVDSFQESQATNLKIISREFDAVVAVVGKHTRREELADNVLYERFDVPTFTPATLENIVVNNAFPILYRNRGGLFADINPQKLRAQREKAGLSQQQLADSIGISKKSVYEHEHEKKKALIGIVGKMERFIGQITDPAVLEMGYDDVSNEPKDPFEGYVLNKMRRIGFGTDMVYQSPFNIIAKSNKMLIMSKADQNTKRIEKTARTIAGISEITDTPALAITKESIELNIPSISEKELGEIRTAKELRKLLH